ncbi:MAG TPA: NblA-related protein [Cyanobacteria bacterium UBA8803]|nr:NblA-related protein [Cyanobacteria bacterium UBA9273]HBL62427.1 NblA-related protein [Cyanobacteria bacterium UBA8803]
MRLSLEQEFNLKAFEEQIKDINLEQAKVLLTELYRQLSWREAYFKYFIKQIDFLPE